MISAEVVVKISRVEAVHLADLVEQFIDVLSASDADSDARMDPAIARLVPDAYTGDPDAAAEFRSLTQADLLGRRDADARTMLSSFPALPATADLQDSDSEDLAETISIPLRQDEVRSWLRTLAAVRLVMASRLGIETAEDHDDADARFGIYDWLGYRLDDLVRAATSGDDRPS